MAEKTLKENQVKIGNEVYTIAATKMKYIKQNFYGNYMSIKKIGFVKLVSSYLDGIDLLKEYLKAVFDLEEISDDLIDNLDAGIISRIRLIINKINEIEDEDEKNEVSKMKEMV